MPRHAKQTPVKYTSREYASIRTDLIEHAKRYYPDTFQDFSEASFGSLMLDTVAYVGDMLSFYVDYQANESFLDTALEYNNIIKLGRQVGYKFQQAAASSGIVAFFIVAPANSDGAGVDDKYLPVLKKGSIVAGKHGNQYTLVEDISFANPKNEIVVGEVNQATGVPTSYAIKAYGTVISGLVAQQTLAIGEFERFLRIGLASSHITEVVRVFDAAGHEYYEVDYLSQDVIYREVTNTAPTGTEVPSLIKPFVVPRRFLTFQERGKTFLQFGYGSEDELDNAERALDSSNITLDLHGKNYVTDQSFDPAKLISTDKLGVGPSNTVLTIVYRVNTNRTTNASAGSITEVSRPTIVFPTKQAINAIQTRKIIASLEAFNEDPIIGSAALPSTTELKERIRGSFASQNRAVTKQDYITMVYQMPSQFGSIKRCTIAVSYTHLTLPTILRV